MRRLLYLALVSVLSLWAGFIPIHHFWLERFLIHCGYYFIFLTFVIFAYWLFKVLRSSLRRRLTRKDLFPVVVIAGASLFPYICETVGFKIIMDEIVLLGTSMNMHFDRKVEVPNIGNRNEGEFRATLGYFDKRPFFHPFLISLLHDLTGYRPENSFVLNILLTPLLLVLIYLYGRRIAGSEAGTLGVLLIASVPLFAQNAVGGHFEILNLVMIMACLHLSHQYLERREPDVLVLLCFAGLLLAQTRYESIFFILPVGLVIILGWIKEKRIILPRILIFAPLLLVCCPMQFQVIQSNPEKFWQLEDKGNVAAFSVDYVGRNLNHAANYLYHLGEMMTNSILLSVLGSVSLLLFLIHAGRRVRPIYAKNETELTLCLYLLAVLLSFALIMFYHWGQLDDIVATRLCMPLLLMFILTTLTMLRVWPHVLLLASVVLFGFIILNPLLAIRSFWEKAKYIDVDLLVKGKAWELFITGFFLFTVFAVAFACVVWMRKKNQDPIRAVIAATLVFVVARTIPITSSNQYFKDNTPAKGVMLMRQFFRDHPDNDYFFTSKSGIMAVTHRISGAGVRHVREHSESAVDHFRHRTYSAFYVFQLADVDAETGEILVREDYDLGPRFRLSPEPIMERRIRKLEIARIMKVLSVEELEKELESRNPESLDHLKVPPT